MFKVNDVVVYIRDVCKITSINNTTKYYTLKPIDDDSLTIKIPFDNDRVRGVISKKEVEKCWIYKETYFWDRTSIFKE